MVQTACSFVANGGKRGRLDYLLFLLRRYAERRRGRVRRGIDGQAGASASTDF